MIIVVLNKKRRLYVRKVCVHNRVRQQYGQGLWSFTNKASDKKSNRRSRKENKAHNYLRGTKNNHRSGNVRACGGGEFVLGEGGRPCASNEAPGRKSGCE